MWAPYENLFTELHTIDGSRIWKSSGAKAKPRGPHAAARPTAWNISCDGTSLDKLEDINMFPMQTIVGVLGYDAAILEDKGTSTTERWLEPIENVYPANLYEAQLKLRFEQ